MKFDSDNFQKDVIERSHHVPVLVDFWAEWCAPCKMLGPILEKLASKSNGRWELIKIDTEKHPEIAMQYRISSIPSVKLFVDGQVIDEFVGALPEQMIVQWLNKALPDPFDKKLKEAENYLYRQNTKDAQKLLNEILKQQPSHQKAKILLAQTYLYTNPNKAEELVEQIDENSNEFQMVENIRIFIKLFNYLKTPERLPENPVKNKYLQAIKNLHSKDYEKALKGFIEVLEKNRSYDDDGSRKACIAIFKFLGEDHLITRKYRPIFSRTLYV